MKYFFISFVGMCPPRLHFLDVSHYFIIWVCFAELQILWRQKLGLLAPRQLKPSQEKFRRKFKMRKSHNGDLELSAAINFCCSNFVTDGKLMAGVKGMEISMIQQSLEYPFFGPVKLVRFLNFRTCNKSDLICTMHRSFDKTSPTIPQPIFHFWNARSPSIKLKEIDIWKIYVNSNTQFWGWKMQQLISSTMRAVRFVIKE